MSANSVRVTDKQLLLGVSVFLLLFSINEKEVRGKRVRKKIIRAIKTELAKYRNVDSVRYLELVNAAREILIAAKSTTESRGMFNTAICPAAMLRLLQFKYMDDISVFNIDTKDVQTLKDSFGEQGNTWFTVKYTNILMDEVIIYVKQDLRMVSFEADHICGDEPDDLCPACKYEQFVLEGFKPQQIREMVSGYSVDQNRLVTELKNNLKQEDIKEITHATSELKDMVMEKLGEPVIEGSLPNAIPFAVLNSLGDKHAKKIY